MILLALVAAAAAAHGHPAGHASSKAISCQGQTIIKSADGESTEDFDTTFILNDTAKTWRAYSYRSGGSVSFCEAPQCILNYGTKRIVGRSGKLLNSLDREEGTFRSANLERGDSGLIVTTTEATCEPIPMPSEKAAKAKF